MTKLLVKLVVLSHVDLPFIKDNIKVHLLSATMNNWSFLDVPSWIGLIPNSTNWAIILVVVFNKSVLLLLQSKDSLTLRNKCIIHLVSILTKEMTLQGTCKRNGIMPLLRKNNETPFSWENAFNFILLDRVSNFLASYPERRPWLGCFLIVGILRACWWRSSTLLAWGR